jgi:hypothetical protein
MVCVEKTMVVESKGKIKQIAESDCWQQLRGITFKRRFIIVTGICGIPESLITLPFG